MTERLEAFLDGGYVATGLLVGFVLGALRPTGPVATRPLVPVLLSVNAGFWVYACTPDTELARLVCGIVAGAGAVAIGWSRGWERWAVGVTVALAIAAIADGAARTSAVVGSLGVVVIHGGAQLGWRRQPVLVVVVAVVASAFSSRWLGVR